MYKILINDYKNGKQTVCRNTFGYFLEAVEYCEQLAFNFIAEKEGTKYFERSTVYKPSKFSIKKGYGLTIKKNGFMTKITIFLKEPNGYVLSGELKKVIQFTTFREKSEFVRPQIETLDEDQEYIRAQLVDLVTNCIPLFEGSVEPVKTN
jgi:hypothetical protein